MRNQLVSAAEKSAGEENSSPVLMPTMSKDMEEQFKLAHKVDDVVDRANRKICVILQRYNVDQQEGSFARIRLFARRKEVEKIQQFFCESFKLEKFIYLNDVMNSVRMKVLLINLFVMSYKSNFILSLVLIFPSIRARMKWNIGDNRNFCPKLNSKFGLYHIVLTTPKSSPEKFTVTVVQMQQLPHFEISDSKEEISCLKWTTFIGRRKSC